MKRLFSTSDREKLHHDARKNKNMLEATLADEEVRQREVEVEMDLKTPTVPSMQVPAPFVVPKQDSQDLGSMSHLLQNLLQQVQSLESGRPTVMASEHFALQTKLAALEENHSNTLQSYNELLILRNGDLENLIKVRGLLAEERREHAAIRQLRDDDLENVLSLREKLAKATWSGKMPMQEHRKSLVGGSTVGNRASKSDSSDLWQQAKSAAMEQRILELEKANDELRAQVGSPGPVVSSAPTVHSAIAIDPNMMSRVEVMFEDNLRQREKMATKVQLLRSEKDALQKEVASLEDRNGELEALVERLKRGVSVRIAH
jgi:hypothetical protein